MKRNIDIQKDIIIDSFKKILNLNTIVINGFDGEGLTTDFSIYIVNQHSAMSAEKVLDYSPDFCLIKIEGNYQYGVLTETSPQTYWEPADFDYIFSCNYPSVTHALEGLIKHYNKQTLDSIIEYHILNSIEQE